MTSPLTAFFPSAGHGTRLRPFTDRVPKPAIPFLGESALAINVRAVDAALRPARRLANAHHLPDAIRAIARSLSGVEGSRGLDVIHEPELLGTGGCLAGMADLLQATEHFLVHNADLIHDLDLGGIYAAHCSSGALATLVGLRREGAPNTLSVDDRGGQHNLIGVHGFEGYAGDPHEAARLTFAGVAFYRRDFLAFVPAGASDIKPWWNAARAGGGIVRVADAGSTPWFDFGTPQGLWDATKHHMTRTGVYARGYPAPEGTRPFVSNEAGLPDLPAGLRNLVVYEPPRVPLEADTTNLLTGRDFDWKVRP